MGDRSAFFYGMVRMSEEVLYRVCFGSSTPSDFQRTLLTSQPAILHGYCRHRVRYGDYPAIVDSPDSSVRGTYIRGLTEGDIWRLDIFEGDEYERRKVRVKVLRAPEDGKEKENGEAGRPGGEVEVETYIWIAGKEELEDGEWDFEEFRREKMHRWVGQRDDFDEVDEAVRAQGGDPTGGRGMSSDMNGQLGGEKEEETLNNAV